MTGNHHSTACGGVTRSPNPAHRTMSVHVTMSAVQTILSVRQHFDTMACLASHYASLTHLHAWAEDHEELLQAELKQLVFGADARDLTDGDDIAARDGIIVMSQRCIAHRVGGT